MTAETTLRLAKHANIIGIKEASGNLEQCMKIQKNAPKDFAVISGDDMLSAPFYAFGEKGIISVLANSYPVIFRKIKEHAQAGNMIKAHQEQFKLLEINGPMYEEGNPVGVKEILSLMNVCGSKVRLPLAQASDALQRRIGKIYESMK